jgi:hypothetical protein
LDADKEQRTVNRFPTLNLSMNLAALAGICMKALGIKNNVAEKLEADDKLQPVPVCPRCNMEVAFRYTSFAGRAIVVPTGVEKRDEETGNWVLEPFSNQDVYHHMVCSNPRPGKRAGTRLRV